jgi:16S rRNA (guanine1207-N2)-methyltransferase
MDLKATVPPVSDPLDGGTGHYFERVPEVPSSPSAVRLELVDVSLTLTTDRGVFSGSGIDPGTKFLLTEAPAPPVVGDLVDLGCGYGPIALTLASRAPRATVWAVDVNERARDLCRANADAAGLTNVEVVAPDDVPADLVVHALWSNPPIRIGKSALHELLSGWLARLSSDGVAVLVVQKHLGADSLARWIEGLGYPTARRGSRQGYRLLESRRG